MVKELPQVGEVVVCKVSKILDYGVFVDLLEYEGVSGFVHISQVASSWVKNIRTFVKENQIRAAQVQHIDYDRGQIDLSLTKVSAGAQRSKIDEWKALKRSQKLLEILASEKKAGFDSVWKEVAEPLVQKFGSLPEAFNEIAADSSKASEVPEKFRVPLVELLKKNIEVPKRTVKGVVTVYCEKPNGAELIREALVKARASVKNASAEINYIGSGRWDLRFTSSDFKIAEKAMGSFEQNIGSLMRAAGGKSEFKAGD